MKLKQFFNESGYTVLNLNINRAFDEAGKIKPTSNALHDSLALSFGHLPFNVVVENGIQKDFSKGVMYVQKSGSNNNAISLYSVTVDNETGKFTVGSLIKEVDSDNIITKRAGVSRISNTKGKSNALMDLGYVVDSFFKESRIKTGSLVNITKDPLAELGYHSFAKVSKTNGIPGQIKTMNLDIDRISKGLNTSRFEFSMDESKRLVNRLFSKKGFLTSVENADDLFNSISSNYLSELIDSSRVLNSSNYSSLFKNKNNISTDVLFDFFEREFSKKNDIFNVKKQLHGILGNKKYVSKYQVEKAISVIGSSFGVDLNSNISSSDNTFEKKLIAGVHENFISALNSRKNILEEIVSSDSSSKKYEIEKLLTMVFNESDSRKKMLDISLKTKKVANLHHSPSVSSKDILNDILLDSSDNGRISIFSPGSGKSSFGSSFNVSEKFDFDESIKKHISNSDDVVLKQMKKAFKDDEELMIKAYNFYKKGDAIVFTGDLNHDELRLKSFFYDVYSGKKNLLIDLKGGKTTPNLFGSYSVIGSKNSQLDNFLKSVSSSSMNKILYSKRASTYVDIGLLGNGFKLPTLEKDVFSEMNSIKGFNDKVLFLKESLLKTVKGSSIEEQEKFFYGLEYLKGKNIRYSSGINTEFNSLLMASALNNISENDIKTNIKSYEKYQKTLEKIAFSQQFRNRKITTSITNVSRVRSVIDSSKNGKFMFFDIETSGFDGNKDFVDEISFIRPSTGKAEKISMYIGDVEFSKGSSDVRKLSVDDVNDIKFNTRGNRLSLKDGVAKFLSVVEEERKIAGDDFYLAGHNIENFDIKFLNSFSKRLGLSSTLSNNKILDTLGFAEMVFGNSLPNNKLGTLYEYLTGHSADGAHDSLVDIGFNKDVFEKTLDRINVIDDKKALENIFNNPEAFSEKSIVVDNSLADEYKKLSSSKKITQSNKFSNLTIGDLLDDNTFDNLLNQSNEAEKSYLRNSRAVALKSGVNLLYTPESTFLRVDGAQINLGSNDVFKGYYHVDKNINRALTNDYLKTINNLGNIIGADVSDPYSSLYLLKDMNDINDLKNVVTDNRFISDLKKAALLGVNEAFSNEFQTLLNNAKNIRELNAANITALMDNKVELSTSFSNKEKPAIKDIFHQAPTDFLHLGHHSQDESARYFASSDLQTIDESGISSMSSSNNSKIVNVTAENYKKSVGEIYGSKLPLNERISNILFVSESPMSFDSSSTLTKKTVTPLKTSNDFHKTIKLETFTKDMFLKTFSGHKNINDIDVENFNPLSAIKTLINNSDMDYTVNFMFSEKSKLSFLIDRLEKESARNSESLDTSGKYNELMKLSHKIKAVKELSNSYSPEEISDILNKPGSVDNVHLNALNNYVDVKNVSTDAINRKIYKMNMDSQKGVHSNHVTSVFKPTVSSSTHKVYDGIGYNKSYLDGSNLVVQMKSYSAPTSGTKYSVQSIKTDARIVDKLELVSEGRKRSIDGVLKGEISKRGLDQFKHYLFVQTALNNLEYKEAAEFLADSKDILELMKMEANYKNGIWRVTDPLNKLLIDNGFDFKKDNLIEFLKSRGSDDLFTKNMKAFSDVKNNLLAKHQTIDNVVLALNNIYEGKIKGKPAKKIYVAIDKIIEKNDGFSQEFTSGKPEYGLILSTTVNRMIDIDAYKHGGAMKISYFSESLLDVAGYGSYKRKIVSKNRRAAFEYLIDVDNKNSQRSIGNAIERSHFAGRSSRFDKTTKIIRDVSNKHFSSSVSNDWLNTGVKRTAFINIDEINMDSHEIYNLFSDADLLFKHDIIENRNPSANTPFVVGHKNSPELRKYRTTAKTPDISFSKDKEFLSLQKGSEEFSENITHIRKGSNVLSFENILGSKIAEAGLYTPGKSIDGKIALYSKKNVEMYESMSKAIRLYLDNVPIDSYGSDSISYNARLFFSGLLKGEDTLKNKSVLNDIEENLELIKQRLILDSETSSDDIFGFVRLKNIVSIAKDSKSSPRGFQNTLSFFKNKGYFYREINLSNIITTDGEILNSEGLKDFFDFYKSYEKLGSSEVDININIVKNLKSKNYSAAISDLKRELGKFYQTFPNQSEFENYIKSGTYNDALLPYVKGTLFSLKNKYSIMQNLTGNVASDIENIDRLLANLESFNNIKLDPSVVANSKNKFVEEFGEVVHNYETQVKNIDDNLILESNNVKRLIFGLVRNVEDSVGSSNYFKNLLKTSYEFFSITDKKSNFFTLLREKISDSTFVRPVDGSISVSAVMDLLFDNEKKILVRNKAYLDEVFGNGFFDSLITNNDDTFENVESNLKSKSNYVFKKSSSKGVHSEFQMIARHPTQTTLHFSPAKVIFIGADGLESENPFVRHFASQLKNLKNNEQVYVFGNMTLKMMLGDFDSDDVVLSKIKDAQTNNLMTLDHALRNDVKIDELSFTRNDSSVYKLKNVLNSDAKIFLQKYYSFDSKNDISGTVGENLNYFLAKVSGISEEMIDVKKFYFDSAKRLFKGNVDAEITGSPEKFIGFIHKLSNNDELYNDYLENLKSANGESGKILKVFKETYLKSFSGDFINEPERLAEETEKFVKEVSRQFKETDPDEIYSKNVNIKNTGLLYEYVSKLKITNESLIDFELNSYKSHFGGSIDVDFEKIRNASYLADQFYSSAIQTPIGAKNGKSLDLGSFKTLVAGVQKDDELSDYFHNLYEKTYDYYVRGKKDSDTISDLLKLIPGSDKVNSSVFESLTDVDLTNKDFKLSYYYKNALGFVSSQFKGFSENEVFESIVNKNLDNVHLKDFLVQFSAFYETVVQTKKVANLHHENILKLFSSNIEFSSEHYSQDYSTLISKFSDSKSKINLLSSFSQSEEYVLDDIYESLNSINKHLKGLNLSDFNESEQKNINSDSLKVNKLFEELNEFKSYYRNFQNLDHDTLLARQINPDAEIFTNKDKNAIERKSWFFSKFFDEILVNKYSRPVVGEKSALYQSKLMSDVASTMKTILLTREFLKSDKYDIGFLREVLTEKNLFDGINSELSLSEIVNTDTYKQSNVIRKRINSELLKGLNKQEISDFFKQTTLNDVFEKFGLNSFFKYDESFNKALADGTIFKDHKGAKITDSLAHFLNDLNSSIVHLNELNSSLKNEFGENLFEGNIISNILNNENLSTSEGLQNFMKMFNSYQEKLPEIAPLFDKLINQRVASAIETSEILGMNQNVDELLSNLFKNASKINAKPDAEKYNILFFLRNSLNDNLEGDASSKRMANVLIGGFDKFVNILTGSDNEETFFSKLRASTDSIEGILGKAFSGDTNKVFTDFVYNDLKLEGLKANNKSIYEFISSSVDGYIDSVEKSIKKYAELNDFKADSEYFKTFKSLLERDIIGKLDEKMGLYDMDQVKNFIDNLPGSNSFSKFFKNALISENMVYSYMQNGEHTFNSAVDAVETMASVAKNYERLTSLPKKGLIATAIFGAIYGVQKIRQHRLEERINEEEYKKTLISEQLDANLTR